MRFLKGLLVAFLFLAVSAGATNIQVVEAESRGPGDLSGKKLRAMTTVYLAELGHAPSSEFDAVGVSLSASGPGDRVLRMKKFSASDYVYADSAVVADAKNIDDALEAMLKRSFGKAPRLYKSEWSPEVFFMDPEFIDIDDSTANFVTRNAEKTLEDLGYELAESHHGVKFQMFLMKLKDVYWLGMIRIEGSRVVKGVHKKITPEEDLETVILSLTNKVMDLDVRPEGGDSEWRNDEDSHEAKCRATESASSVDGFFAGLTFDILCHMSDYIGLDFALGGRDLYGDWYPNFRFGYVWGFSDTHAWIWGLDYAGTMGQTRSRWSFESIHRFSQSKGFFFDFIWGWGFDGDYDGWYLGSDIGYNLIASKSKAHWLSLMFRYDWTFGEPFSDASRISVNLVYSLRGYFSD